MTVRVRFPSPLPSIYMKVNNMAKQKNSLSKKQSVKAETVLEKSYRAIEKEIAKEFREEAKQIIELTSEETRNEFLRYFDVDKGNICCLVLDKAKHDLIAQGKMVHNDDDAFGKPFML